MFGNNDSKSKRESVSDGPRPEYVLAHVALRHVLLANPVAYLHLTAEGQFRSVLADLMDQVARVCGRPLPYDAESLSPSLLRLGPYPSLLIEFPEPVKTTDVYLVVLVLQVDLSKESPPQSPEQIVARYLTLEKGMVFGRESPTVFCEWTADDKHCNYGEGPSPTVEAFCAFLEETL